MSIKEFTETLNKWGNQQIPFLFLVDFEMKKPLAFKLSEIDPRELTYNFNGITNGQSSASYKKSLHLNVRPISISEFEKKFSIVLKHLEYGDSYLTNLTIRTMLDPALDMEEIFLLSRAKYKLRYKNEFLFFSPETFIQIKNGSIFSYPMKGTIDASLPDACERLLADTKELAEHVTIVDLIRNDLSEVSSNVKVNRFRYIDELKTNDKTLLQVSSEIAGDLDENYLSALGSILVKLLPAGSVSGAPKTKTIEIIRQAEGEERGYYTGVAGIFDGRQVDSGVMIRFIEQQDGKMFYRSGGGITTQSILEKEYQEAIDKVYVPFD
jgi:para-aminobenzoate synthetase component 1